MSFGQEAPLKSTLNRLPFLAAALAAAVIAACALTACGGGESDGDSPQGLNIKVAKGDGSTIKAPKSIEAGLTEITLTNEGTGEADLQLVRVERQHSDEEVAGGFNSAVQGQFPAWFFPAGGIGLTGGGESASVTQVLQPGTYYAFNTESPRPLAAAAVTPIKVTGEHSDVQVAGGAATIEAREYAFESKTLPAGTNKFVFANVGKQPHHMLASQLIGDSTAKDVEEQFFKINNGKPPISEKSLQTTAVLEGGEAQLVTFNLKPGRYAFYCFITDRQGGEPHALKGMVDEIEVK